MTEVVEGRLAQAVTARSFDDFYENEYASVVRLTTVLTGRRELAEELAQEAFLAAYRRWESVRAFDDAGAWVRRVATNQCVSSGRRHLTELRLLTKLRGRRDDDRVPEPAVDDHLWRIVRSLPRRQAQVLALAFVEDRSVPDIAAILGCGEETVRTHLRRGRLQVADRLGLLHDNERQGDDDD